MADKGESEKQSAVAAVRLRCTTSWSRWAEDEFRSVNGQIEYLLTEAVRKGKSTDEG